MLPNSSKSAVPGEKHFAPGKSRKRGIIKHMFRSFYNCAFPTKFVQSCKLIFKVALAPSDIGNYLSPPQMLPPGISKENVSARGDTNWPLRRGERETTEQLFDERGK